jgi:chemotaxis protein MotB
VSLTTTSGGSNAVIQLENQDFQRIQQLIQQAEQQAQINPQEVSAQITSEGIAITVSGALLFYNRTNQIKPEGITLLQHVGSYIATLPNPVRVEGHTDDIPEQSATYPTNWELSAARAVAVVRFFAEVMQVTPQRLSAVGFGQYQPIVPNDTRAHREQNRRAVIVILYGSAASATASATPTP